TDQGEYNQFRERTLFVGRIAGLPLSPAERLQLQIDELTGLRRRLDDYDEVEGTTPRTPPPTDHVDRVVRFCERFDCVARQLRTRQRGRPGFEVNNEYDVQDLLCALLQTDFDDVRREERAPSSVGSAPIIDFLLKAERIGIEVKMVRDSMTARTLGDELLADI